MIHFMLKYLEVITNIDFIKLTTTTLELRGGVEINSETVSDDNACIFTEIESLHITIIELND